MATYPLRRTDGSIAAIHSLANDGKRLPVGRLDVFRIDGMLALQTFAGLVSCDGSAFALPWWWTQVERQTVCTDDFMWADCERGASPLRHLEIVQTASFSVAPAEEHWEPTLTEIVCKN